MTQQIINSTGVTLRFKSGTAIEKGTYELVAVNSQGDDIIGIVVGGDFLPVYPRRVNNYVEFPPEARKLPRDSFLIVTAEVAFTLAARNQEVPCRIVSAEGALNREGEFEVWGLIYWPDCKPPVMRETFEK